MGLAMMLLVSGICLYTAYRILQTYTLHSRTVKISEFGDLCGLLLGTGSITPSSEETVELCRTGAQSRPSYQCYGYGFIESGSGSSISSEYGSGSRILITKN
jgi:hypothetical protein